MDKLKMHSPDLSQDNISKIRALFPNCVTESSDDRANLKLAIDFDQLKQELSDSIVEGPQERYQLNWPGKREALLTANAPIAKTLRPCREESINFDTTENLFIEGDNLEALKLLQETYLGKVKMIYIDPPYNTGKDFVYKDNFSESSEDYLARSNQMDEYNNRLTTNPDSNGKFHSDWLSMMLPRIKLARNLLSEDGVIFISIDENEVYNLQKLCDEVFGEQNVMGSLPVVMNLKGNQDSFGFAETHEFFIVCCRSKDKCLLNKFLVDEEVVLKSWSMDEYGLFKEADNLRATGVNAPREKRPNLWYPIFLNEVTREFYCTDDDEPLNDDDTHIWPINPDGEELSWYWSKTKLRTDAHNLILKQTANGWQFYKKQRPSLGDIPTQKPKSFFYKPDYSTSTATNKLKSLFGSKLFDGPKPVPFIEDLIQIGATDNGLVLDFFAGSGSTGEAVLSYNAKYETSINFILVQIPEVTPKNSPASIAGFDTISKLTRKRIELAINKIKNEFKGSSNLNKLDFGSRFLKIDSSNMTDVFYRPDQVNQTDMFAQVENIKEDRNDEDLLFQVLLDWGVGITLPISKQQIASKDVFHVNADDDGEGADLIACFSEDISNDLIKELAEKQPLRVVFRDDGFANDSVKINAEQIFKQISPMTDVKSI
jgi:adenine-specific DNA-methyltransferase